MYAVYGDLLDTHTFAQVDMMEHPLHTISYVADIDNVLVVMAHVVPVADSTPPSPVTTPVENREELVESYIPKMTCHVLDTDNVSVFVWVYTVCMCTHYCWSKSV